MNGLVVDTSIVLAWVFDDESNATADSVMQGAADSLTVVPGIWWYEFHNALLVAERRGRISATQIATFWQSVEELNVEYDTAHDESVLTQLARAHRLSAYDAAHLEVAQRRELGLATLDKQLVRAAQSAGVPVIAEDR